MNAAEKRAKRRAQDVTNAIAAKGRDLVRVEHSATEIERLPEEYIDRLKRLERLFAGFEKSQEFIMPRGFQEIVERVGLIEKGLKDIIERIMVLEDAVADNAIDITPIDGEVGTRLKRVEELIETVTERGEAEDELASSLSNVLGNLSEVVNKLRDHHARIKDLETFSDEIGKAAHEALARKGVS